MQGQPEADRRRPGPAQGQALGGHGQGQDVGRRISCRGRQERGVEGSPRVSVGLREEFCTALRISTDRSVGQFHPLHSKWWFCKISTELPICWNPRTGLFNAKRRPNWTVMLSTMLNLSVDSRKLLMSGQGLSMKEGIASQKSISCVLCNETQYLNSDLPNPSFEVFLILKLRRRSENKVGWNIESQCQREVLSKVLGHPVFDLRFGDK